MYLNTCTIYGDVSVTSTSRDLILTLSLVVRIYLPIYLLRILVRIAPPHSYEIPSQ